MAWLQADPSGNYHVSFRFGGRKFKRSLRTTIGSEAEGRRLRLEENIRLVESGRLAIPVDADVPTFLLSDGKLNSKVVIAAPLTLSLLLDAYFEVVSAGNLEESTIRCQQIHRRHLERHFGDSFVVQRISLDDLQSYVAARAKQKGRRGRKVGGNTIGKEIETFRAAWNWGMDAGKLKGVFPKKGLRFPKQIEMPAFQTWEEIERQIEQGNLTEAAQADLWDCLFLSLDEIDELLKHVKEAARQPFIYPMYVMAAHTGARRSELLRSHTTDFNCDAVTIRERKRVRGKQSTRRVPLSNELRDVMNDWFRIHPGGNHTFCHVDSVVRSRKNGHGPRAVTRDEAHDHFKRPLTGSKWEKIKGWHCFRHSFCSNCAMKGIDQRIIDAWVGHTTEEMRRRYRHLFPNSEQQAMGVVFG